uniref:Reverse transcriptase Ty1/copia-type domain-containing protein n=1 Tax=Solanum lycopersicum TaxID=4081 RepID=A0A3Q7I3K1_SOLLC
NLHYFISVEVIRSSSGLILTQANYVNEILNDELMTDCKSVNTPISACESLTLSNGTHLMTDATHYLRILHRLQYPYFSRMDIAYAVNKFSIHESTIRPSLESCEACSPITVWYHSTRTTWSSKKQNISSRSSTEFEYKAVANDLSETLWFSIKDLGNLHYFIGVEVIRSSSSLILTQSNYVNEILNDELMTNCKSVNTPMSAFELLTLSDGIHLTDVIRYRQVLGRLQYLFFTEKLCSLFSDTCVVQFN